MPFYYLSGFTYDTTFERQVYRAPSIEHVHLPLTWIKQQDNDVKCDSYIPCTGSMKDSKV